MYEYEHKCRYFINAMLYEPNEQKREMCMKSRMNTDRRRRLLVEFWQTGWNFSRECMNGPETDSNPKKKHDTMLQMIESKNKLRTLLTIIIIIIVVLVNASDTFALTVSNQCYGKQKCTIAII